MSEYISEKGDVVEVGTMNSFRLVNGLTKASRLLANAEADMNGSEEVKQKANVQNLSAEIISRLAPKEVIKEIPEEITPVILDAIAMPNGEIISCGKTCGYVKDFEGSILKK